MKYQLTVDRHTFDQIVEELYIYIKSSKNME